jgi:hypothetical protein
MKITLIRRLVLESLLIKAFLHFSGDLLFLQMDNYFYSLQAFGIKLLKVKLSIALSSIERTF